MYFHTGELKISKESAQCAAEAGLGSGNTKLYLFTSLIRLNLIPICDIRYT